MGQSTRVAVLAGACIASLAAPASAQDDDERPAAALGGAAASAAAEAPRHPASPPKRVWYGWQTLTMDGLSVAVPITLAAAKSDAAAYAFGGFYLFGPAVVHWTHENVGTGFASVGVRVGSPLVGLLAGCAVSCGGRGDYEAAFAGLFLGYAAAVVLDAAAFAWEDPEPQRYGARPTITPTASIHRGGGTFGLVGSF